MAASRSMLESLLERVRQRAAEPRVAGGQAAASATARPVPVAAGRPAAISAPSSAPAREAEEEVEEYDEELIEIIDDGDVASDSEPEPSAPERAPLELSASVPSVEMRRRVVAASGPPPTGASAPMPPVSAPVAELRSEPLRAEAVARRPVTAQVVHTQGARPDLARGTFIELLDASLRLGR